MKNADGTPYQVTAEDGGWRLNYGPNNPNRGEAHYDGSILVNYGREESRHAIANGEFTATLYPGDYIQVANVNSGVTYSVEETDIPSGYTLMGIEGSAGTVHSETSHQVTVKNKIVPKAVSFSKVWLSMTANVNDIKSTDLQAWPEGKTISVTLKRLVDGNKDDSFALTYTIDNGDGPFKPTSSGLSEEEKTKYQLSKTSGSITAFTSDAVFETQDADGKPYTYYIEETEITGGDYLKYYGTVSGDTVARVSGAEFAQDGGVIINQESGGYELPATGGSGTNLFYILGALMIAGAGLMLLAKRRRQS